MKDSPNQNQLETTVNDEESSVTNTDRNNRISYPTVSASIQNRKQLPTISSNANTRPSLGSIGRSKTSPEGFNSSSKKPSLIKKEHSDNEEKYDFPSKVDIHSDVENQSKSKDEKDLNNNNSNSNGNTTTTGEIVYSIETVLKYLEENYYLRWII